MTVDACFCYVDIQLYTMEVDTYLVDFKCAGYESAVRDREKGGFGAGEEEGRWVGTGYRVADKDVTMYYTSRAVVVGISRGEDIIADEPSE
ncbi:MAG: hypothetical protein Q9204_007601 [Flavoplaca sp. TL-2023a]